jgi:hypothetical protein
MLPAKSIATEYLWPLARAKAEKTLTGLSRRIEAVERDFDPSQPRDDNGQWTDGGGSGEAGEGGRGEGSREGGKGRARSADEATRRATQAAAGKPNLEGLPKKTLQIGGAYYTPGPLGTAKDTAAAYMSKAGLSYDPATKYVKVDSERATRIAAAFEEMKHEPDDPKVKASYEALASETLAQWQAIKETGLKVEWIKEGQSDPYAESPRLAAMDVVDNNHWWGFPTDAGFGGGDREAAAARTDNPMLRQTDEVVDGRRLVVNDVFRIVHDYFGHFKEGVGFRSDGEDNAWRSHASMYSELARGAMTTETRGQNSWVNYGPNAEHNRTAKGDDTIFAPQKIGLLPDWVWKEDADAGRTKSLEQRWREAHAKFASLLTSLGREYDESQHPRDESGKWTDGGGGGDTPTAVPKTPDEIDANKKVHLGTLYRGTGKAQAGNLRVTDGDLGRGVYLTKEKSLAESYGGGPNASVQEGTRVVTAYSLPRLFPDDVAYVFGGKRIADDVVLVSGTGIELWRGEWNAGKNIESALAAHEGIKAVIGTPESIGLNQVAIRDPSILTADDKPARKAPVPAARKTPAPNEMVPGRYAQARAIRTRAEMTLERVARYDARARARKLSQR